MPAAPPLVGRIDLAAPGYLCNNCAFVSVRNGPQITADANSFFEETPMDFLISSAMAQDAAQQAPSMLSSLLPLILIVVIFWFLLIRPQMKRNKQHRELVAGLSAGDEVVTAGGMLGKITEVGESFVSLELTDGVVIKLQRHSVAQVVPKGTIDSSN
ncbi:preprotein translocase subunit YajC [Wenzhouxiangella sediminis]